MSSIHAFAAPNCITASAALGSSSLVFDLQASTLLPVLQASTLLRDLQAPTLLPILQASPLLQVFKCLHCFQVFKCLLCFQVFKCLHCFQVFKCHHCFRCIVLAIVLTFPLNLYVLRSFYRLTSWTGGSHHRSEICPTELVVFQTRCAILARLLLQGHADLHHFSKITLARSCRPPLLDRAIQSWLSFKQI